MISGTTSDYFFDVGEGVADGDSKLLIGGFDESRGKNSNFPTDAISRKDSWRSPVEEESVLPLPARFFECGS